MKTALSSAVFIHNIFALSHSISLCKHCVLSYAASHLRPLSLLTGVLSKNSALLNVCIYEFIFLLLLEME